MRCQWAEHADALMQQYHDEEWGVWVAKDQKLFEMLLLESFHTGLSWRLVLSKREAFKEAFDQFDPLKIAAYDEEKVRTLKMDKRIIRNEAKIRAAIQNARCFLEVCQEFGSFSSYLDIMLGPKAHAADRAEKTSIWSDQLSSDMKKRGFRFMGSITTQSWLEAIGRINAHEQQCFRKGVENMSYVPSEASRQKIDRLMKNEKVQKALQFIRDDHENTIQDQLDLVVIPAPTFHEEKRAAFMVKKFQELGLQQAHLDRAGNAVACRKGSEDKAVVLDGHMDTVYPLETEIHPKRDEHFITCPGITDDTRACAAMLSVIRALDASGIQTKKDLIFVTTVQEEGKGGFGGMKAFFDDHDQIDACINMDGAGASGIVYQSTGFKTIEATFHGIGGHAYGAFGKVANPLHAAARAIAKIADLEVPEMPKTTYCVSNFHAGNDASIHAIVPEATIKINYRSNGQAELEELDRQILRCLQEGCDEESARWGKDQITLTIKTWCDVKAGSLNEHDPIVEAAWCAIEALGNTPRLEKGGPTNASIPISRQIPAVCIGSGDVETFAHNAEKERFPLDGTWQMPQLALLLVLAMSDLAEEA